jgi:cytochrome c biogenesis protein CcmG, thiol:disulfide interchange protein DsbE
MTQKSKTSASQKRRSQTTGRGQQRTLFIVAGIGLVVVVAAVIAISLAGATPAMAEPAASPVQVSGAPLPEYADGGTDLAVGRTLPTLTGTDMAEAPLTIGPDGRAKAIIILAHQCPHCQAELPRIVAWLADNPVPDGVDVVGISTAINPAGTNYPPSTWFEREGWDQPTLNDDANATAYRTVANGMGTPGWLFITADGVVQLRTTGELDPADFGAMLEGIAP